MGTKLYFPVRAGIATALCWFLLFFVAAASPVQNENEQERLKFAVISDVHVRFGDSKSQRKLQQALADLHSLQGIDTLVINGDFTNGRPVDYQLLQFLLKNGPHPQALYFTIGNHEFYKAWINRFGQFSRETFPNGESENESINRFLQMTGENQVYYDKWIRGYHFIFLGSEHYRQTYPFMMEEPYLSAKQLDWLEKKLHEKTRPDDPEFVFLHQPITEIGGTSENHDPSKPQHLLWQTERLRQILSSVKGIIFFSGHTHYALSETGNFMDIGFLSVNSSSVYQPYSKRDEPLGTDASEGLVVQVYSRKVLLKGRDFARRQWISGAQHQFIPGKGSEGVQG